MKENITSEAVSSLRPNWISPSPNMAYLAFPSDDNAFPEAVLDAPRTTVGRSPGNTIVLEDEAISGQHAEIVLRDGTFLLRDLGSSNGTKVNSNPVVEAELKEGDRISFGSVECVFKNTKGNITGSAPVATSEAGKASGSRYCTACGSENPQQASFCGRCGTRIESVPPTLPSRLHAFDAAAAGATAGRVLNGMAQKLTNLAGVAPLQGLSGREFFSEALKRRTDDDIEELFITGTSKTTPPLAQVDTRWPKPWAFLKALIASLIVFAGFLYGFQHFGNPNLLPGLIFVGSFGIPLSTLILFVELNVVRNVSLYQIAKLAVFGGIASLLLALVLYTFFGAENSWGGALAAGIVEETAKVGAVVILTRKRQFKWTINGLLLGAAVGAGFAAFESAGYALTALFEDIGNAMHGDDTHAMLWKIGLRAIFTPAGHIAWTALAAAALWRVRAGKAFDWQMCKDPRFVRVFILVATLHFLWDAPIEVPLLGGFGSLAKWALLGIVAWIVVLSYVQFGLKEIRDAQTAPATSTN